MQHLRVIQEIYSTHAEKLNITVNVEIAPMFNNYIVPSAKL